MQQVFIKLPPVPDTVDRGGPSWDRYYYPLFTHKETEAQKDKPQAIQDGTDRLVTVTREVFLSSRAMAGLTLQPLLGLVDGTCTGVEFTMITPGS